MDANTRIQNQEMIAKRFNADRREDKQVSKKSGIIINTQQKWCDMALIHVTGVEGSNNNKK